MLRRRPKPAAAAEASRAASEAVERRVQSQRRRSVSARQGRARVRLPARAPSSATAGHRSRQPQWLGPTRPHHPRRHRRRQNRARKTEAPKTQPQQQETLRAQQASSTALARNAPVAARAKIAGSLRHPPRQLRPRAARPHAQNHRQAHDRMRSATCRISRSASTSRSTAS